MKQQRNKITVTAKIIYNILYISAHHQKEGGKTNLLYTKRSSILNFKILSWFNTGIKNLQNIWEDREKSWLWGGPQTCICYPTVNYLRSSALISSPTAWSLLFMKGNRLENEKFFFFFSFAFICCTFPFVCEQKMEDACTGNFLFSL